MTSTSKKIDLDKLKKLIRLATNNPNEHEASLAAIKACRMILEDDFNCLEPSLIKRTDKPDFSSTKTPGFDPYDIFKKGFWEAGFGGPTGRTRSYDYETPSDTIYENQCQDCSKRVIVKRSAYRSYWTCEECLRKRYPPPSDNTNTYYDPVTGQRKAKTTRIRKCTQCGAEVETKRITAVFRCNKCEWEDFMNHPPKKKKDRTAVPNCWNCHGPINRYNLEKNQWQCDCGQSYISEVEANARGIKFT